MGHLWSLACARVGVADQRADSRASRIENRRDSFRKEDPSRWRQQGTEWVCSREEGRWNLLCSAS